MAFNSLAPQFLLFLLQGQNLSYFPPHMHSFHPYVPRTMLVAQSGRLQHTRALTEVAQGKARQSLSLPEQPLP